MGVHAYQSGLQQRRGYVGNRHAMFMLTLACRGLQGNLETAAIRRAMGLAPRDPAGIREGPPSCVEKSLFRSTTTSHSSSCSADPLHDLENPRPADGATGRCIFGGPAHRLEPLAWRRRPACALRFHCNLMCTALQIFTSFCISLPRSRPLVRFGSSRLPVACLHTPGPGTVRAPRRVSRRGLSAPRTLSSLRF